MVSLKRPIIFTLLLLIVIPAQNAIALTYLPDSTHYSGKQYSGAPGNWIRIEFAVYDNGGQELIDYGLQFDVDFELPWTTNENDFVYAYQVINDVTNPDDITMDFFSISGIGDDAIELPQDIDSMDDAKGGHGPETAYSPDAFSSVWWEFKPELPPNPGEPDDPVNFSPLATGEHSSFLLIKSTHDYKVGSYSVSNQGPQGTVTVVPNPEPGTLALFGLGSALLLKRQRKK